MSNPPETANREMPYLAAAVICERVLIEKDGTASLIRLVDTVSTTYIPDKDEQVENLTPAIPLRLTLFLSFRGGPARGKREAYVILFDPAGDKKLEAGPYPMVFTGEEQGQNINIELSLVLKDSGTYWFEIVMAERALNRVPLVVNLTIQTPEQTAPVPETSKTVE